MVTQNRFQVNTLWLRDLLPVEVTPGAPDKWRESWIGIAVLADGRALLRIIRSGSKPGRFDLLPVFGLGDRENDVEISRVHWAVHWIFS